MGENFKCDVCGKELKDREGLESHKKAKHSGPVKKKQKKFPKKRIQQSIILIVVVGLLAWGIISISNSIGKYDEFSQCLVEKGITMYGNDNCPHCQRQKNIFGSSWSIMEENYVRCGGPGSTPESIQECQSKGIQSTPTWEFSDGTLQPGVIEIKQLDQRVQECEVNN